MLVLGNEDLPYGVTYREAEFHLNKVVQFYDKFDGQLKWTDKLETLSDLQYVQSQLKDVEATICPAQEEVLLSLGGRMLPLHYFLRTKKGAMLQGKALLQPKLVTPLRVLSSTGEQIRLEDFPFDQSARYDKVDGIWTLKPIPRENEYPSSVGEYLSSVGTEERVLLEFPCEKEENGENVLDGVVPEKLEELVQGPDEKTLTSVDSGVGSLFLGALGAIAFAGAAMSSRKLGTNVGQSKPGTPPPKKEEVSQDSLDEFDSVEETGQQGEMR
jgi:hypothetical protein